MGVSTSEILHFKWLLTVAQTKELPPPSFADDMFRPPVNRAMRVLDRSFFKKRIPLAAARVLDNTKISKCRKELERSKELLRLERIAVVRPDPEEGPRASGRKCLLLQATVIPNGAFGRPSSVTQYINLTSPKRYFYVEQHVTRPSCKQRPECFGLQTRSQLRLLDISYVRIGL